MRTSQPPRDLLGRPADRLLLRNFAAQTRALSELSLLGSACLVPRSAVRRRRSIALRPAVAGHLARDRRRGASESVGDLAQRLARRDAPRDLLALDVAQTPRSARALGRSDATGALEQATE